MRDLVRILGTLKYLAVVCGCGISVKLVVMFYLVVALCTVAHNGIFAAFFLQFFAMKVFLVLGRAVFLQKVCRDRIGRRGKAEGISGGFGFAETFGKMGFVV